MASKSNVSVEIKNEIIKKVKEQGQTVADISKQYGISDKTIYGWLKVGITPGATVLDNNRLKRENQQLLLTIGLLTATLAKAKKGLPLGIWLPS
jgi:transposase-like protein